MMNFLLLKFDIHAFEIVPQVGLEQNFKFESKWSGTSPNSSTFQTTRLPSFPTSG